jgi:hypothetical protein
VNVICHQAVAVNCHFELLRLFPEQAQKNDPVVIDEENILFVITALGDMVGYPRNNNSCYSRHG